MYWIIHYTLESCFYNSFVVFIDLTSVHVHGYISLLNNDDICSTCAIYHYNI